MLVYFKIVRDNHPKHLTFHFGESGDMGDQNYDIVGEADIGNSVSIDELRDIFTAEDYKNDNDPQKLKLLVELPKNISEETYTDVDFSEAQLECNLV